LAIFSTTQQFDRLRWQLLQATGTLVHSDPKFFGNALRAVEWHRTIRWNPFQRRSLSRAQAKVDDMANDLLDKIPAWLKSLWDMENELRSAARNGLILRKGEASVHLAEARRLLEKAMNEAKGIEPANGPQTPLRKEGEF
jgi:hypothetical protein